MEMRLNQYHSKVQFFGLVLKQMAGGGRVVGWLFESFGEFMASHKGGLGSMSQVRLFKFIGFFHIFKKCP